MKRKIKQRNLKFHRNIAKAKESEDTAKYPSYKPNALIAKEVNTRIGLQKALDTSNNIMIYTASGALELLTAGLLEFTLLEILDQFDVSLSSIFRIREYIRQLVYKFLKVTINDSLDTGWDNTLLITTLIMFVVLPFVRSYILDKVLMPQMLSTLSYIELDFDPFDPEIPISKLKNIRQDSVRSLYKDFVFSGGLLFLGTSAYMPLGIDLYNIVKRLPRHLQLLWLASTDACLGYKTIEVCKFALMLKNNLSLMMSTERVKNYHNQLLVRLQRVVGEAFTLEKLLLEKVQVEQQYSFLSASFFDFNHGYYLFHLKNNNYSKLDADDTGLYSLVLTTQLLKKHGISTVFKTPTGLIVEAPYRKDYKMLHDELSKLDKIAHRTVNNIQEFMKQAKSHHYLTCRYQQLIDPENSKENELFFIVSLSSALDKKSADIETILKSANVGYRKNENTWHINPYNSSKQKIASLFSKLKKLYNSINEESVMQISLEKSSGTKILTYPMPTPAKPNKTFKHKHSEQRFFRKPRFLPEVCRPEQVSRCKYKSLLIDGKLYPIKKHQLRRVYNLRDMKTSDYAFYDTSAKQVVKLKRKNNLAFNRLFSVDPNRIGHTSRSRGLKTFKSGQDETSEIKIPNTDHRLFAKGQKKATLTKNSGKTKDISIYHLEYVSRH